jgi:hypothetical protein
LALQAIASPALIAGRSSIEALGPDETGIPASFPTRPENHYRGPALAPSALQIRGRGM